MGDNPLGPVATPAVPERALRVCLDVNVFVSDFLSRRRGNPAGSSSKIVDLVRSGTSSLGPVQLLLSWRMLTTLDIVLERLGEMPAAAWVACELLASVAEFGPSQEPPAIILGATGLLPLKDSEDAGVAETAFAGKADLFITADLDDFEFGPRSALNTTRLRAKPNGKPQLLILESSAGQVVVAVVPEVAVGWLLGETPLPKEVTEILARANFKPERDVLGPKRPGG